jgi:hypothetical protein
MIRGLLCVQCNSWLGVYEANLRRALIGKKQRGGGHFKGWILQFKDKIDAHLLKDTGLKYYQGCFRHFVEWTETGKWILAGAEEII